jgi:hypothetical protein
MVAELSEDQRLVLRLCCQAVSSGELPYWEAWFSPKAVLSRYATRENRREQDLALVLESLIAQGYLLLPPADRDETAGQTSGSLPTSCQVSGLGFEKYAETTYPFYLDWVEHAGALVEDTGAASPQAIAERLGIDPVIVAHILRYHELV